MGTASLCRVVAVSNCVESDITSYAALKRVEVEFVMEHVDMILGHNVEYRG